MNDQLIVLLPCAGCGSRFGGNIPKQYTKIGDKSVLLHTLEVFLAMPEIDQIVIVVSQDDKYIEGYATLSPKIGIARVGGDCRAQSVLNGLQSLKCNENDWVLVHDVARCCITVELVRRLIGRLIKDKVGGILAIPATDTLKLNENGFIAKTVDRSKIYLAQTPQMFRYKILLTALNNSTLAQVTDEASSVENLGLSIHLIEGAVENIKLTYPTDVHLAKIFLDK